jgi:uncharacterized protein YcbK (DUF882 family)
MILKDRQLTKNFRLREFKCRCRRPECRAKAMSPAFLEKLQRMRDLWGKPLAITSGSRCSFWNSAVGGSEDSQHLKGLAADIALDDPADGPRLKAIAEKVGMGGVGIAQGFIHVDDGPKGRRWTYS